ncbi:MAG: hypothetical protein QOG69_1830 [Actinomycetota bacterium]|jgi:uncharacterized membrane protein|nr:hypothetical protein [Actinomycetota bacterium]
MARRERPQRSRLDQPKAERRVSLRPDYDPEAFGRLSERFARFLGTARFIIGMTVFIVAWLIWNTWGPKSGRFDPHSLNYTLLTLLLSLQASYAAPLILLAQNRQADRDRIQFEDDRSRNERNIADTEYLAREVASLRIALGDVATRDFIRGELQRLLEDLDERRQASDEDDAG